ncbi:MULTISPECIES: HdeD family acid-resistance protein [unclassified Roseovarius]|uniref:HdeD family acid-resistance protein n=1 Tax=unclassified Roseovarius TaxID=2614913 RepID=UPI00273FC2C3|nr:MULTISPECIES: HdeD family acid-resistance protein [unclassified Roseovarius]
MQQADETMKDESRPGSKAHGRPNPKWLIALGIATLLIGFVAIAFPLASTLAIETFVGSLFLTLGLVTMVHAFMEKAWNGFLWALLIGGLHVIAGMAFMANPLGGVLALTVMLGVIFLVEGVLRIVLGVRMRPNNRWGLMIASGAMSILLAIMVLAGLANGSSLIVIGVIVGVNFVFAGLALLQIGLDTSRDHFEAAGEAVESAS